MVFPENCPQTMMVFGQWNLQATQVLLGDASRHLASGVDGHQLQELGRTKGLDHVILVITLVQAENREF